MCMRSRQGGGGGGSGVSVYVEGGVGVVVVIWGGSLYSDRAHFHYDFLGGAFRRLLVTSHVSTQAALRGS